MQPIVWPPPLPGLLKINCDAAVAQVGLKGVGCGVARYSNTCFLWGLAVNLGKHSFGCKLLFCD